MKKATINRILGSLILCFLFLNPLYSKNDKGGGNNTNNTPNSGDIEVVSDTVMIWGSDFTNNQGLDIKSDGRLEIFGDLTSMATITIAKGGVLIVYGDLICPGTNGNGTEMITINGTLIVLGSCSVGLTKIDNTNGNMVVGGEFTYNENGNPGFSNSTLYILDPEPDVTSNKTVTYGDADDFENNESGNAVHDLVENLGLLKKRSIWKKEPKDSLWTNPLNWKGGVPDSNSSVEIVQSETLQPVIREEDTINVATLILETKSSLTLEAGASLNISDNITNLGTLVLESTSDHLASLMLPSNPTKAGEANVRFTIPKNRYWYLSNPLKNSQAEWFGELDDNTSAKGDWVFVLRDPADGGDRSWLKVKKNISLYNLEGVSVWYYGNDKALDYSGTLNTGDVSRTFEDADYYMVGNPFPTAIDWENPAGWDRSEFSNTMWSFTSIGEYRVLYSYNYGDGDLPSASSLDPEDLGLTDENISYIPPYQAVWVQSKAAGASLTIRSQARVSDNSVPLKGASLSSSSSYNLIRVKVKNKYAFDGSVIQFNNGFDNGFDISDSEKRFNSSKNIPEVFTRIEDTPVSINGLPALGEQAYSISLCVRNRVQAPVTLSVNLSKLEEAFTVFLEDTQTQIWTNMRETPEYVYTPAELGENDDRFVLHIQKVTTALVTPEQKGTDDITISGRQTYARVSITQALLQQNDGEALISVLDMNGRLLNQVTINQEVVEVNLPGSTGLYVVRVQAGRTVKSEKIMAQNR